MRTAHEITGRVSLERNIRTYMAGRILLAAGGFVSIPLLNRGIGVENYGLISLWTSISSIIPLILGGWLQQSTLRYHKSFKGEASYGNYCLTTRRVMYGLTAAAGGVTLLVLALTGRMSLSENILTACLAAATLWNMCRTALAQAELNASRVVAADFARTLLPIALFALQMLLSKQLLRSTVLADFLAGMVAADLILTWTANGAGLPGRFAPAVMQKMFAFGLPMGIWFGLASGQLLVGRVVLQHCHMAAELGFYTTFLDFFSKTGTVLFMPITYALHGEIMALWAGSERVRAQQALRKAYGYQGVLMLLMLAAVAAGHAALLPILFGTASASVVHHSGALMLLLSAGVALSNLGLISHKGMEVGERTAQMAACMVVSVAINAGVSLVLAPMVGVIGVAAGLFAGNLFYVCATQAASYSVMASAPAGSVERVCA